MHITPETPHVTRNWLGCQVNVPQPFKAGPHKLTEGEAAALNQTFLENVRNNTTKAIEQNKSNPNKVQEIISEYAAKYEFGVRTARGGGGGGDPVRREAIRLAKDALKAKFKKDGKELPDTEAMNTFANKLVDGNPNFMNAAAEIIATRQKVGEKLAA